MNHTNTLKSMDHLNKDIRSIIYKYNHYSVYTPVLLDVTNRTRIIKERLDGVKMTHIIKCYSCRLNWSYTTRCVVGNLRYACWDCLQ